MASGQIVAIMIAVLLPILVIYFGALMVTKAKNRIRKSSRVVSDRDLLKHLASSDIEYHSIEFLAKHFGLAKKDMKSRINNLRRYVPLTWHGYYWSSHFSLAGSLPQNFEEGHDDELTIEVLQRISARNRELTMQLLVLETGLNIIDLAPAIKYFTKEKALGKITSTITAKTLFHILNPPYQVPLLDSGPKEDQLELEVIELAKLNSGKITVAQLAHEKHLEPSAAQKQLESLKEKNILDLALDENGEPEFVLLTPAELNNQDHS